jgi:hypothetical protein
MSFFILPPLLRQSNFREHVMQAVIVNMVLQTVRAWELGVEGHVCEVQLMIDAWPFMRV